MTRTIIKMTELAKRVAAYAEVHEMRLDGSVSVLAAISGGVDSMAMLALLRELGFSAKSSDSSAYSVASAKLYVAHFNHRLRGAESDRDCEFVRSYCETLGVPCYIGYGDALRGDEGSAREQRYAFLTATAKAIGAEVIATAHNCDDNAETMLLNLARGAGTRGLSGIPPRRGTLVRPLLCITREELEVYLAQQGIPHIEDSTNAGDAYARNRLRHHVLPILREINPQFAAHALEAAQRLRADEEYLQSAAALPKTQVIYGAAHAAAGLVRGAPRALAVRRIASLSPHALSAAQLEAVLAMCECAEGSAEVHVCGGRIVREYDALRFTSSEAVSREFRARIEVREIGRLTSTKKVYKDLTHFLFKKSEICGTIFVSSRKKGDKIALYGRNVTKSVKKLFIEMKIPAAERDTIPIIADDAGVLAIAGIALGQRASPELGDEVVEVTVHYI